VHRASQEFLRKKGLASAEKKASRAAKEGIIETYIHTGAKLGVMVEVNCETDFVAKRPEFQELAKAVAMQIAASPTVEVVSEADISEDFIEREKKIESQAEDLQGKPEQIIEKIVVGAQASANERERAPRLASHLASRLSSLFAHACRCAARSVVLAGRVQKIVKTKLLLEQPYIRDPSMNVDEFVKSYVSKLGENIKVARFVRFNVGEGAAAPAEE